MRYEVNDHPPRLLALGVGAQAALLAIVNVVVLATIVVRAGRGSDAYLHWASFSALIICGLVTVLQSVGVGRVGARHFATMAGSQSFIAISIVAIAEGGPGTFAALVLVASLFQLALAGRLSLLRRIITPTVTGVTVMLITVTVMPVLFRLLTDVPEGTDSTAPPLIAGVTIAAVVVLLLLSPQSWRLWSPGIGMVAGCVTAAFLGLYNVAEITAASWVGFPTSGWPGLTLDFDPVFWSLLPVFVLVAVIDGMVTVGDSVAIQSVSWRRQRSTDFRSIQGAVAGTGVSTLLSGLAGAVPNKIHILTAGVVEMTGVSARVVGMYSGAVFVLTAFLPKIPSLLLAIPSPVIAAYTIVFMGLLFSSGVRIILQGGLDYRKAVIVGLSFWIGVGFENDWFYPEVLEEYTGLMGESILGSGLAAGGISAIVLTGIVNAATLSRWRMETQLDVEALSKIRTFLENMSERKGLDRGLSERLCMVAEEALLTLIHEGEQDKIKGSKRRLRLTVRAGRDGIEMEFVAVAGDTNIEDRLAVLNEEAAVAEIEHELSLRLLRHLASSVRHQQFYDTDVMTVTVQPEV